MLTGVTRPFHAPHALFTPSTGGTYAERARGNELFGRGIEVALALFVFVLVDRHFGAMCRGDTPGVLDYM